jgi:cytoskeleton protein RodZ
MTKVTRLTVEEGGGVSRRRIHLREISGDMDAPLETVGQDLRAARLRRGDDLATVSRALKIRKDHLEALEEDRMEALPGRTYAVGFVRSYSDYLGLDAVQCVERFKAEIAGRSHDTPTPVTVIDEDEHRRLPQGWKIIAGVVLVLLIYGAYYLLVPTADRMLTPPVSSVPQQFAPKQASVTPAPAPVVAAPVTVSPATDSASNIVTPQPGTAPVQTSTANPAAPVPKSATAPASGTQTSVAPVQEAAIAPGKVYGEQNRNARVVLRVKQATKVLIQGPDGMVYLNRTLGPGDTYQVPNRVGMTLTTSNAGAVEVDLDGLAMGLAGHDQQMQEALSLDPQAIVDRYNGGRSG